MAKKVEKAKQLTISVPRDGFSDEALTNLQKIVDSKQTLLKKALGAQALPIEITEETVAFPWFPYPEEDGIETAAYTHLVQSLCEMAKKAKRVTATEKETESEKYTFRCFLLRLGFVGTDYKHEREILMRNLSGYAAFKNQAEADAFYAKLKEKKAAKKKEAQDNAVSE